MLIPPENHRLVFQVLKDVSVEEIPVISILVAVDTDAICACKILTGLLQTNFIPYTLRPTRGLEDLYEAAVEELSKDIKILFLINCGGGIDLADFLNLSEDDPFMIYVLDSHRPFNVKNIHHPKIALIDDGTLNIEDLPDEEEIRAAEGEDSEEEDEEDEEEEDGEEDAKAKKAREQAKRKRKLDRLLRRTYKIQIEPRYYVPSGTCAAGLMYEIASQVSQPGNELLWAAIVGLTDQWVHGRISYEKYTMEVEGYQTEVKKYNEDLSDDPAKKRARLAAKDSIQPSDEYQFMLYRHWNLYDSMWHSRYIATRLGIWKEHGKKVLDTLLARVGLPLQKCTESYATMDVKLKQDLKKNLVPYAKQIGLDGICYPSFIYQKGYQKPVSAADKALIVAALLGRDIKDKDEEGDGKEWIENFMDAFSALSTTQKNEDYQRLQSIGIERAIAEQKAVIRQGATIIERKIIRNSGRFRYVILHQTPDLHFFSHPLALSKLALFLVEYLNETNKKQKPFLICAKNEIKSTYLVVGVTSMDTIQSSRSYGNFGRKFRQAALRTGARICHHGFDSAVVEVAADDIFKFVEFIQST